MGVKKNISSELQFCIEKLTAFQADQRRTTTRLLDTNFNASTLRISRRSAEIAVSSAPLPPAKAAAKAALEAIKILQKLLVAYQQSLLNKAYITAIKLQTEMFVKGLYTQKTSQGLVVEPYPENSDSPSYRLKANYQEKKAVSFYKYIDVTKGFPAILKRLPLTKLDMYFLNCGATLKNKGGSPSDIQLILGK